jgi:hypothetical protein
MHRLSIIGLTVLLACGNDEVSSTEEARLAYVGLDRAVDRALSLGMAGFNAAQSANIDPQSGTGDVAGTLTVTGQVDQGASDNKGLRLFTAFVTYQDRVAASSDGGTTAASGITYDTDPAALPALTLSLRNIPDAAGETGTFTGTLMGKVHMSGDLKGDVTLNVMLAGDLRLLAAGSGIERTPGTTHITGTATSDYGVYTIDVTR